MIRKIQRTFVITAMALLLTVLVVIIGGINIVNFAGMVQEADALLDVLAENDGRFPEENTKPEERPKPEDLPDSSESAKPVNNKKPENPTGPGNGSSLPMSPETPFETRYFSVVVDPDTGSALQIDTGHIAAVNEQEAAEFALEAFGRFRDRGFCRKYRYLRTENSGQYRIIFVDCGRRLDSVRDFLLASTLISVTGYLLVSVLLMLLSQRVVRPIAESYDKQKQFITDASHEIKTPLTIIRADVDILEMDLGENEWLQDIQKQAQRLTDLTRDLVMLSRMEEGGLSVPMIDFPVSDVVAEAASAFHAPALAQHKTLDLRIQPMLSLHGSDKAIGQLVNLLLDNALKYSPADAAVTLTLTQQNRTLRLEVSNPSAAPLPRDNLNVLFERFYRTDPSRNTQTGGYGIGLSVAKAITELHKGRITASSPDGQSLTVTAVFPLGCTVSQK